MINSDLDGSIVIGTSVDMKGMNEGLKKIADGWKTLAKITGGVLGIKALLNFSKAAISAASDLQEVQNIVDVSFEDMEYKVEQFASTCIDKFGISELAAKQTAGSFMAMGKALDLNVSEASDMSLSLTALTGDFASFYNISQDYARVALSAVYTGETETLKRYGIVLTQVNLQEYANSKGINANVKTMSARNKTILRYNYIIEHTRDIEGDFVRTQDTWANQTRVLQQRWRQFLIVIGNGLITVLTPLIKYLNLIISRMITFAKVLGQILSNIFGIKFQSLETSTANTADNLDDTADSAEDAADSAEDAAAAEDDLADATDNATDSANDALAAWDDLNVLQMDTAKSAKASAKDTKDTGTSADDLDLTPIDTGLDLVDKLKENIQSDIDSLYGLGKLISDKLRDMLEKIDWDKIFEGAKNFGKGLADFLNGLIQPDTFKEIGKTLANVLNTVIYSATAFAENFDWTNFGHSLNVGLNTFLKTLDWKTAFEGARAFGTGLANFLNSLITPELFYNVGSTIANALNTAIYFSLSFGKTLKWKQIGDSLAAAVNGFFEDFDFASLGQTINTWAHGVFDLVKEFLSKIKWKEVWEGVKELLSQIDLETVTVIIGLITIKKIGKFVLGGALLSTIETALGTLFKTAFTDLFTKAIPSLFKDGLPTLFKQIIPSFFSTLITFFTQSLPSFFSGITGDLTAGFSTLFEDLGLGNTLSASLTYAFGPVVTGIVSAITGIGGAILSIVNFIQQWQSGFDAIKAVLTVIGSILAGVGLVLAGIAGWPAILVGAIVGAVAEIVIVIKDNWAAISSWFAGIGNWINTNVIQPIIGLFEGLALRVGQVFQGLWLIVQAVWKIVSEWFDTNVIKPVVKSFTDLGTKIAKIFSDLWNDIKKVWNDVATWFNNTIIQPSQEEFQFFFNFMKNNIITPLQKAWKTAVDAIAGFFKGLWRGIVSGAVGAMNAVIDRIERKLNSVVNAINVVIRGFNAVASWAAGVVGQNWGGVTLVPTVHLGRVQMPALASGAVIPPNAPFMAMLGDQKKGTNIEAPLDTIVQAMKQALSGMNTYTPTKQEANLQIDGKTFARLILPFVLDELNRRGYNVSVLKN